MTRSHGPGIAQAKESKSGAFLNALFHRSFFAAVGIVIASCLPRLLASA